VDRSFAGAGGAGLLLQRGGRRFPLHQDAGARGEAVPHRGGRSGGAVPQGDQAHRTLVVTPRPVPAHAAYDHIIVDYAERYGVDAALVKAIIHAESDFRPKARSRVGARGLMQLMPTTARMYGVSSGRLYEPRSNIHAGVRHLRSLLRTFKGNVLRFYARYSSDVMIALAAASGDGAAGSDGTEES
jgi:soluble lytic murein transglycosylase-like protein